MILNLGCGTGLTSLTTPYNIFYHIGFHILRSAPLADTINIYLQVRFQWVHNSKKGVFILYNRIS